MLSLIICSRSTDVSIELKENIQSTIGVKYELIVIDNSKNKYSIFQAYNEGVRTAKSPYFCFMHEDILYLTQDWGKRVIEHFKDEKIGLIGVGGCHYLSRYPVSLLTWKHANNNNKFYSYNYVQGYAKTEHYKNELFNNISNDNVNVVAIDGMWFCIRRETFEGYDLEFDEKHFKGFHFYDFDICMQVYAQNMKTIVISDILIEHFSTGVFDKVWYDNAFIFYEKWKSYFPIAIGLDLTEEEKKNVEYELVMEFIKFSVDLQDNLNQQIKSIRNSKRYRLGKFLLTPIHWLKK